MILYLSPIKVRKRHWRRTRHSGIPKHRRYR